MVGLGRGLGGAPGAFALVVVAATGPGRVGHVTLAALLGGPSDLVSASDAGARESTQVSPLSGCAIYGIAKSIIESHHSCQHMRLWAHF